MANNEQVDHEQHNEPSALSSTFRAAAILTCTCILSIVYWATTNPPQTPPQSHSETSNLSSSILSNETAYTYTLEKARKAWYSMYTNYSQLTTFNFLQRKTKLQICTYALFLFCIPYLQVIFREIKFRVEKSTVENRKT